MSLALLRLTVGWDDRSEDTNYRTSMVGTITDGLNVTR